MKQAVAKQSVVAIVAILFAALATPIVKHIARQPHPVPASIDVEALVSDIHH